MTSRSLFKRSHRISFLAVVGVGLLFLLLWSLTRPDQSRTTQIAVNQSDQATNGRLSQADSDRLDNTAQRAVELCSNLGYDKGTLELASHLADHGLQVTGISLRREDWRALQPPAIVALANGTSAVVCSIDSGRLHVISEGGKRRVIPGETFETMWEGRAILVHDANAPLMASRKLPKLQYDPMSLDLGEIEPGEKTKATVVITNIGASDLIIDELRTSCKCAVAKIAKRRIPPGAREPVEVTVYPTVRSGPEEFALYLHSNDPVKEALQLTLHAKVRTEIDVFPKRLSLKSYDDTVRVRRINFVARMPDSFRIDNIVFDRELFDIAVEHDDEGQTSLLVRLKETDLPEGEYEKHIVVDAFARKQRKVDIPILVRIQGEVDVYPGQLFFGLVPCGSHIVKKLRMSHYAGEAFSIRSVKTDMDTLRVTVDKADRESPTHFLTAILHAAHPGRLEGFVTVRTDLARRPNLMIPVRAFVVEASE